MVRRQTLYAILVAAASLVGGCGTASAHPHGWIDLRSAVVLDADGRITALEEEWLFDKFYTMFVSHDLGRDPEKRKANLRKLAETNLKGLAPYGYFTVATADGENIAVNEVTEYESAIHDGRIWMRFVAPLATPVDPRRQAFSYAIYDPTYFVAMMHGKQETIAFKGGDAGGCRGEIHQPRPTAQAKGLASTLDFNAKAPNSFGALFAERIAIECK